MRRTGLAFTIAMMTATGCATGGATGGDDVGVDARAVDARAVDAPISIDAADPDAAATVDAAIDAPTAVDAAIDAPIDAPTTGGVPDTCAQAQNITAAALAPGGVTVTGNTTGLADDVQASPCTGFLPDGPDAIYALDLTAGKVVTATATPTTGWDISIEIITPCGLSTTCLAGTDGSAGSGAETASYTSPSAQTVFVVVDGYNPGVAGGYSLAVRVQ